MRTSRSRRVALAALAAATFGAQVPLGAAPAGDARLRELVDDGSIIEVATRVGVATAIELDPGESIAFAATGVGSECSAREEQPQDGRNAWCIAAPLGQHIIFVKPRTGARGENNLQIVTSTGNSYTFRFALLGKSDKREPVYRMAVHLPKLPAPPAEPPTPRVLQVLPGLAAPAPAELIPARINRAPRVVNSNYTRAVGDLSDDIVPRVIFDDGRFTYFRFAPNQELPSVFELKADGTELIVNTQMEGDLLRVDRVARQFYLRQGNEVVRVWNESFDLEGKPVQGGTTVVGAERVMKPEAARELGDSQ
jgi:type IV secretion system protein VirB9